MTLVTSILSLLVFHAPLASEDFEVVISTSPGSAQMEVVVHNPSHQPLMVEELVLELPRAKKGAFMVDLRQFSRVESEIFENTEVFYLTFHEARTVAAGKQLTANVGMFAGFTNKPEGFMGKVTLGSSAGVTAPVGFDVAYPSERIVNGQSTFETDELRFQAEAMVAIGSCKRTGFTVGVTSVTCASPALCLVGTTCQVDNSVLQLVTVTQTVGVPRCSCL